MENKFYNVSSSPHVRSNLSTGNVMFDVILALIPTTAIGLWVHGLGALMVVAASVITAVATEYLYDKITKKKNTITDFSAVVTGLLLALCMPEGVPLYVPVIGAFFAIYVVKCLFGGLGKNFMNPALAGRCFLLISFGTAMTSYKIDAISAATPLQDLANGVEVNIGAIMLGTSNGCIGSSALGLIIGGLFLWSVGGITLEIPVAALTTFTLMMAAFGGQGLCLPFLLTHLMTGGILMGAIFMATDPVTSPVTSKGQVVFGALVGFLAALFRLKGAAADSVSYAIIISNMVVPLINEYMVPLPYGHRKPKASGEQSGFAIPKPAITLFAITLLAGLSLSGIFSLTKGAIEEQEIAAAAASYKAVMPEAESFAAADQMTKAIEELNGEVYGDSFGKAHINEAYTALDASGNPVGYVLSATSGDGFDGNITLSTGIAADGTINGIAFTELHETAGMGMRCDEDSFKGQFAGKNVDAFTLNKSGGASADNEINSISGASISSSAVVNAVNAALDFCKAYAE